jgi:hypothetical protein
LPPTKQDPFYKTISGYLGILDNTVVFIEGTAEIERDTGMKVTDLAKVWGNKQMMESATKQLGAEKMAKFAILLVRLSGYDIAGAMNLPWEAKLKSATELKSIIMELRPIFEELDAPKG